MMGEGGRVIYGKGLYIRANYFFSPHSLTLDSRIISASFLKKHQNQFTAKSPVVKITFQHLSEQHSEKVERYCVFWDLQEENWSDKDCQIIKTNQTHTQCSCNHLTHFALLAPVNNQDSGLVGNGLDFGRIQANDLGQTKDAQKDTSTVITLEIATYLVSSVCLLILVIILVQVKMVLLICQGHC